MHPKLIRDLNHDIKFEIMKHICKWCCCSYLEKMRLLCFSCWVFAGDLAMLMVAMESKPNSRHSTCWLKCLIVVVWISSLPFWHLTKIKYCYSSGPACGHFYVLNQVTMCCLIASKSFFPTRQFAEENIRFVLCAAVQLSSSCRSPFDCLVSKVALNILKLGLGSLLDWRPSVASDGKLH